MLNAVAEFVEREQGECGREGGSPARWPADQPADRRRDHEDGRERGVERAEQHREVVRVLVVVEVDALPERRGCLVPVEKAGMQHVAMHQILDQRVDQDDHQGGKQGRPRRCGQRHRERDADRGQCQIGQDRVVGEIGDQQLRKRHLVQLVPAPGPKAQPDRHASLQCAARPDAANSQLGRPLAAGKPLRRRPRLKLASCGRGGAVGWWALLGLNQRPLRCQRSALPLS